MMVAFSGRPEALHAHCEARSLSEKSRIGWRFQGESDSASA
jgi:hypothetical protein